MMTRNILTALAGVLLAGCGHAAPKSKFNKISNGMTVQQVRQILGVPFHAARQDAPDGTVLCWRDYQWVALHESKWCKMEVYFDAQGRVRGKSHDHSESAIKR